ncbi:MAG: Lpg1974 family pore-forming outer membrane protein, partial [Pirellulales bacterium]
QCAPFVLPAPSGLNAGFEAVIAKPYFATSSAPRYGGGQATVPEKWEFDMAPRAWLGYTLPGGMGGRFRYWQFDHHSLQQTLALPGSEQLLQSRLTLQTFDTEWTQRGQLGRMVFNFAAGVRYATIEHISRNQFTVITEPPFEISSAVFVQGFHGGGPTLAMEMWRPFLERFAFYGIGRGSILFGRRNELADSQIPNASFNVFSRHESLMPIGELQLGMQWTEALGRGVFFARTGVEGQVWGDAGNITAGSSVSGEIFTPGNLGFFGITVATGFAW